MKYCASVMPILFGSENRCAPYGTSASAVNTSERNFTNGSAITEKQMAVVGVPRLQSRGRKPPGRRHIQVIQIKISPGRVQQPHFMAMAQSLPPGFQNRTQPAPHFHPRLSLAV